MTKFCSVTRIWRADGPKRFRTKSSSAASNASAGDEGGLGKQPAAVLAAHLQMSLPPALKPFLPTGGIPYTPGKTGKPPRDLIST